MNMTELVSLFVGGLALLLALLGRYKQNKNGAEVKGLNATAQFLLEQNREMGTQMDALRLENDSLRSEVRQLRLDLGDARALLRNLQPRV